LALLLAACLVERVEGSGDDGAVLVSSLVGSIIGPAVGGSCSKAISTCSLDMGWFFESFPLLQIAMELGACSVYLPYDMAVSETSTTPETMTRPGGLAGGCGRHGIKGPARCQKSRVQRK
jgi:hypothetical protein